MKDPVLSFLGLAKKAGRVEIGEEPVGSAARAKHARVILVASDAAAASVRRAYSFAQTGACLCLTVDATKDALGSALGRTSCAMAAVTDIGFAEAIVKKLAAADPERYAAAAERLEVKARRAKQRRQEQLQHEKKLRQGVKKHRSGKTEPAAPSPKDHGAEKKPAAARPAVRKTAAPRFPGSRPVKKGKGSVKKSK